jgi:hypoxanthine phosphoribosyltransferase
MMNSLSHSDQILIDRQTIEKRVKELAATITHDYQGKELTIVALMKGSILFLADLLRLIPLPLRLEVISVSSYHGGTVSSGIVTLEAVPLPDLSGRHLLLIDDILDSGKTLKVIGEYLETKGPLSLKSCVLLHKKQEQHLKRVDTTEKVTADYVGFEIPNEFVVGYGLDYQEYYRNLPEIRVLIPAS